MRISRDLLGYNGDYHLVNIHKTMENHNFIAGEINYFHGHVQ